MSSAQNRQTPSAPEDPGTELFKAAEIGTMIGTLAEKILEEYPDPEKTPFILIGLHRNGVPLTLRLAEKIKERTGRQPETGMIDITLYRDDIGLRKTLPHIYETVIPDINRKNVILVDGIIQTGRSLRAALDAITDFGRPAIVRLATLFDRGSREFPIRPDYLVQNISVPDDSKVVISWTEHTGKPDSVSLTPKTRLS